MIKKILIGLAVVILALGFLPSVGTQAVIQTDYVVFDGVRYSPGEEIAGLRDQYSRTIYNGGGSLAKTIFLGSIHYEDNYGNFQSIDTTIVPSYKPNWNWEVTTGHWKLFVSNNTTVGVKKGDNWIGTRLHGIAYLDITTKDYTILQTTNSVTPVVSGNKITWYNILHGVDYILHYTNDSLKEEVVIHQTARNYLNSAGHRPSDYGYDAANTYLVPIFECDWSQGLPMKLASCPACPVNPDNMETDELIYFESDIEDPYWKTKLVSFLPVYSAISVNPVNPEDPEGEWEYAECVMKKRLVKKNDKHWLLTGVPVLKLNQMPEGSIIFDPTETLRPSAPGDVCGIGYEANCSACPNHYDCVDEVVADDFDTYIKSSVGGQGSKDEYDLYNLPASSGSGPINHVKVYFRGKADTADYCSTRNVYARIKTYGTNYTGDAVVYPNSMTTYSHQWTDNPNTTDPWTWAEIDALQIGARHQITHLGGGSCVMYTTQVYVVVDYTPPVPPTVTTQAVSDIATTTATGNGNITDTGLENCDKRGIVYGTTSQGDPGAAAPPGGYDDYEEETNSFGTGAFTRSLTGLTPGQIYYARAYAHNSAGYNYGGEVNFYTLPGNPSNLSATPISDTQIDLTWTKGTGGDKTMVRRAEGAYPANPAAGDQVYFDTGVAHSDVGRTPNTLYYYRIWAYDTEGDQYSSGYSSDTATAYGPPSVTTNAASLVEEATATLNGEITAINGANATVRGFEWDIDGGAPYANDWHADGDFGVEAFTHALTSLTRGEQYHFRAYATNIYGTGYGAEQTFLMKPEAPTSVVATASGTQVAFTFVKGIGATKTYIRGKDGSYPTDRTDGYEVYDNTGTSAADTGLTKGHIYYYRLWGHAEGSDSYSDAYVQASGEPPLLLKLHFQPVDIITGTALIDTAETSGTADSGTAVMLRDAILTQGDDYWNGITLEIVTTTDGLAPQGETAVVTDFIAADDELQFAALTAVVGAGDTYELRSDGEITYGGRLGDSGSVMTLTDSELTQADDYWNGYTLKIKDTTDDLAPEGEEAEITDFTSATLGGTADSGNTTTLVDATLVQTTAYWAGATVTIVTTTDSGAPQGESKVVTTWDLPTNTLTFPAMTAVVDTDDTYTLTAADTLFFGALTAALQAGDRYEIWDETTILWGSFPEGVKVEVGPLTAYTDPVSGAAGLEDPEVAGLPTEPSGLWGGTASEDLPLYPLFNTVAADLGWTTDVLYVFASIIVSVGLGVALLVTTGSTLAAVGGVGVGMVGGMATGMLPVWVLIVYLILGGTWLYVSRSI